MLRERRRKHGLAVLTALLPAAFSKYPLLISILLTENTKENHLLGSLPYAISAIF